MATTIPEIPHGKKYHLFVSYKSSTLTNVVVRTLVKELEACGVTCCYYERDFICGRSVVESMYEAIENSSNMLIVLSEDFESSRYCQDELDKALDLRIRKEYNLIPIKIEPCSVPSSVRHLNYIDAEDDIDTAASKIMHAITTNVILTDIGEGGNGRNVTFQLDGQRSSRFGFTRYKLNISDSDRANIWRNNLEMSAKLLNDIEDTVNSSLYVRYIHIWSHMSLMISITFLLILLFMAMVFLVILATTSATEKVESFQPVDYFLAIGMPAWLLVWIIISCVNRSHRNNHKGVFRVSRMAYNMLSETIHHTSKQTNVHTGAILYLNRYTDEFVPVLTIMRYNFKACKAYFASRLASKDYLKKHENESDEECTTRLFDIYLRYKPSALAIPSTEQRHKTANGAKCACLLVDEALKNNVL